MAEASREQAATGVRASIGPPNIGKPTLTENDVRRGLAITWYVAWMGRDIERMPCGDFLPRITGREIIKAYENDRNDDRRDRQDNVVEPLSREAAGRDRHPIKEQDGAGEGAVHGRAERPAAPIACLGP